MHRHVRSLLIGGTLAVAGTLPVAAQTPQLMTDLMKDVGQVEQKMIALAQAIPADKYDWRPGTGVRSIGEVFKHVVSDNYLLPTMMGVAADPSTGITSDYKTAMAFEARPMSRDTVVANLKRSFANLKQTMTSTTQDKLGQSVSMFGQTLTGQQTWILTTTHLHEHLGQAIAYARSVGVVPPWSK
ncbi:MAG: DinB family protein [Gemmatimonadota bacterium]|nr:DinB family protein [Gemmatimonadota bacterium]